MLFAARRKKSTRCASRNRFRDRPGGDRCDSRERRARRIAHPPRPSPPCRLRNAPRSRGERENDWAASVLAADTAVIYMGAGLAEGISAELIGRGKPKATPLVLVESATLPEQRILRGTLADLRLALQAGGGPAVVLLGEVLRPRSRTAPSPRSRKSRLISGGPKAGGAEPVQFTGSEFEIFVSRGSAHELPPIPETVWRLPSGEVLSCVEKLKVLRENLEEIQQICQDALEDAVLMGCDERQFRQILGRLVQQIENPYRDKPE